jgi:hypothetical protein
MDEKQKKKLAKKLKIPRKAKTTKSQRKKGYCGILFLNPTRNIAGEKVQLEGGTYKTKDGNFHYTNEDELLFWEGKYPVLWQRHDKLNPSNLLAKEGEKNQIYGQDMVYLRMKRDLIKEKKKGNFKIIWVIAILVGGYFVLKMMFPNMFGGG